MRRVAFLLVKGDMLSSERLGLTSRGEYVESVGDIKHADFADDTDFFI